MPDAHSMPPIPADRIYDLSSENEVSALRHVPLSVYAASVPPAEMEEAKRLAREMSGRRIAFVNSTPQGGGVAVMRQVLIPLLRNLGVDAHWYVTLTDPFVFTVTKRKIHNALQGVAPAGTGMTYDDREVYAQWIGRNELFFAGILGKADVIVIDDPQPSGLIPYLRRHVPNAKIIYRSHIEINTKAIEAGDPSVTGAWKFLWANIARADRFVFHPVPEFVPKEVPADKVIYMPAITDEFTDLNRAVTKDETRRKLAAFQTFLAKTGQTPLDPGRPFIIQICRFDPSKGIPDVLSAYKKLADQMVLAGKGKDLPQLCVVGNGSVDDPEGPVIYQQTRKMLEKEEYGILRDSIKIVLLPPDDLLLNVLLRSSRIALQLSTSEGFEIKVTEALMKGKPVVVYRSGGIPIQVQDGINGYLVTSGDTDTVARHLFSLCTDSTLYASMSESATQYYDRSFTTLPQAIRWMSVWSQLLAGT